MSFGTNFPLENYCTFSIYDSRRSSLQKIIGSFSKARRKNVLLDGSTPLCYPSLKTLYVSPWLGSFFVQPTQNTTLFCFAMKIFFSVSNVSCTDTYPLTSAGCVTQFISIAMQLCFSSHVFVFFQQFPVLFSVILMRICFDGVTNNPRTRSAYHQETKLSRFSHFRLE